MELVGIMERAITMNKFELWSSCDRCKIYNLHLIPEHAFSVRTRETTMMSVPLPISMQDIKAYWSTENDDRPVIEIKCETVPAWKIVEMIKRECSHCGRQWIESTGNWRGEPIK